MFINLDYFTVYKIIMQLNGIQVRRQFPIREVARLKCFLHWHGLSDMVLVFCEYVSLLFAVGGSRGHNGDKDATLIGGIVLSFFTGVEVSPLVGLRTMASLVGDVVVFTRP